VGDLLKCISSRDDSFIFVFADQFFMNPGEFSEFSKLALRKSLFFS